MKMPTGRVLGAALGLSLFLLPGSADARNFAGIARVIDGDTIAIGDTVFRLNGVAAPERREPGGRAATRWMRRHLAGRTVTCKPNGETTYGRIVAVCYVDGQDIGAAIVRAGRARDCPRYSQGRYSTDERAARSKGLTLWKIYPLPPYC